MLPVQDTEGYICGDQIVTLIIFLLKNRVFFWMLFLFDSKAN